ncbi:MAG: RagB/SusD family nutrient uptake outer membrane protein [Tannerella sp.]|jgi:hypothetical protein|nr:RagB/SusD family nutrient uptake outer membrane protein [Tannerella sp.]
MKTIRNFIIAIALLLVSCNESFFEKYPLDQPSDATFLRNETELKMAVAACYDALYWLPDDGVHFQMLLECISDHGWDRNTSDLQQIGKGTFDAKNNRILGFWQRMYMSIARCNLVLNNINDVQGTAPSVLTQAEGEVRFLRAFFYSFLAELYGGVPLVKTPLQLSEAQMPKSSKEEIVTFLLEELETASGQLSAENNPKLGRATKGAALALKSRIALYNGKWDIAIDAASRVMQLEGTQYELYPHYGDLFMYKGQHSKESVFGVNYLFGIQTNSTPGALISRIAQGMSIKIPSQQRIDSYECTDGKTIDISPLFDPKKPFENRDPRLKFTCVVPGETFYGYQFETHRDSLQCWNYNLNPPARVANTDATHDYASFSGYLWRKYCDETVDFGAMRSSSELSFMLIRYAEVLLNYAEAKIEAGQIDNSVLTAINKVRQRPSVNMPAITTLDQAALRQIVRKERSYELGGEGLRFFDIKRWGYSEIVMNNPVLGRVQRGLLESAPTFDERGIPNYNSVPNKDQMRVVETRVFDKSKHYLWPIPFQELEVNKVLEQNPNY